MNRMHKGLALVGLAIAALITFVVGLYVYVVATTRPLHPDVRSVPLVTRAALTAKWTDAAERGRQIMRAGLTVQNLAGLSVAVGIDREIVWAEGFGYADLETRVNVTPETRFRIGAAQPSTSPGSAERAPSSRRHRTWFDSGWRSRVAHCCDPPLWRCCRHHSV